MIFVMIVLRMGIILLSKRIEEDSIREKKQKIILWKDGQCSEKPDAVTEKI